MTYRTTATSIVCLVCGMESFNPNDREQLYCGCCHKFHQRENSHMPEEETRAEHLAWCKKRALDLLEAGEVEDVFFSMVSDLNKHSETRNHLGINLGSRMLFAGLLKTPEQLRQFIGGFN